MEYKTTCYFLLPGLSKKYRSGGLMVIQDIKNLLSEAGVETHFIATHEKHPEALEPDAVFRAAPRREADEMQNGGRTFYFVSWGPLVEEHIKLIRRHAKNSTAQSQIIYYAQSFGWGIRIPNDVAIACVSRYVMTQWAMRAPRNFITYIPPPLKPCFGWSEEKRPIDVLVHARKQSAYCLETVIPAIAKEGFNVEKITDWISQEQFAEKLASTKLFLYITQAHRAGFFRTLPGEGFGLPALEAIACGAIAGSNLLGGVNDFLTPGENCIKLHNESLDYDMALIKNAIANWNSEKQKKQATSIAQNYRPEIIQKKWLQFFESIMLQYQPI